MNGWALPEGAPASSVTAPAVTSRASSTSSAAPSKESPSLCACPSCKAPPPAASGPRRSRSAPTTRRPKPPLWTRRLDSVLLHRVWGPLIFLAVVIAVFQVVFTIGQPLSDGLGRLLTDLGAHVALAAPRQLAPRPAPRRPLERRAVRARLPAADPSALPLHRHPRRLRLPRPRRPHRRPRHARHRPQRQSLHPAALRLRLRRPAIMATRTIENKRERLATILVAPFMTCSARLPIYTLIIAAFIPNRHLLGGLIGLRAAVMLEPLRARLPRRARHRAPAQLLRAEGQPRALHPRAAAVPLAHAALPRPAPLRPRQALPQEGRHHHPRRAPSSSGSSASSPSTAAQFSAARPTASSATSATSSSPSSARSASTGRSASACSAPSSPAKSSSAPWARSTASTPQPTPSGLQAALRHDMTLGGAIALVVFFAFAMQCTPRSPSSAAKPTAGSSPPCSSST